MAAAEESLDPLDQLKRIAREKSGPASARSLPSAKSDILSQDPTLKDEELTSAFLCEAADIETRLRSHILELLEPTIRKHGKLEAQIKENQARIDKRSAEISELWKVRQDAEELHKMVEDFRQELSQWDKERRTHEQEVGHRLSVQEAELNALRSSLEKRGGDSASMNRAVKGLGDLVTTAREETSQLRSYIMERVDMNRDKVAKLSDEFHQRTTLVENQMHQLKDNHTCLDTVINHINETVSSMSNRVQGTEENIADLWRSKATVANLEEQQLDMAEFMRTIKGNVSSLKNQFGSLVGDVKSHFQEASNVLGKSTAVEMDKLRSQHKEELRRVDRVLEEVKTFVNGSNGDSLSIKADLLNIQGATQRDIEGLKKSVEELDTRNKVGDDNFGVELAQLRKQIGDLQSLAQGNKTAGGVRGDILEMMVETQLLSAHLEMQDDMDRKNIALFGYKSPEKEKTGGLPELHDRGAGGSASARGPRKKKVVSGAGDDHVDGGAGQILSLDNRCLSCSASMGTVISGFKMACLSYSPGQVEIGKTKYSRTELISQRLEMLKLAKDQLKSRSIE